MKKVQNYTPIYSDILSEEEKPITEEEIAQIEEEYIAGDLDYRDHLKNHIPVDIKRISLLRNLFIWFLFSPLILSLPLIPAGILLNNHSFLFSFIDAFFVCAAFACAICACVFLILLNRALLNNKSAVVFTLIFLFVPFGYLFYTIRAVSDARLAIRNGYVDISKRRKDT